MTFFYLQLKFVYESEMKWTQSKRRNLISLWRHEDLYKEIKASRNRQVCPLGTKFDEKAESCRGVVVLCYELLVTNFT